VTLWRPRGPRVGHGRGSSADRVGSQVSTNLFWKYRISSCTDRLRLKQVLTQIRRAGYKGWCCFITMIYLQVTQTIRSEDIASGLGISTASRVGFGSKKCPVSNPAWIFPTLHGAAHWALRSASASVVRTYFLIYAHMQICKCQQSALHMILNEINDLFSLDEGSV